MDKQVSAPTSTKLVQAVNSKSPEPSSPAVIHTPVSFSGVNVGISTQGFQQQPIKISFKQSGNRSTGTYSLSGMLGTMNGTFKGNAYNYTWRPGTWRPGGLSGKGVSNIKGNTIEGTWGFDSSNNNAGTVIAQMQ